MGALIELLLSSNLAVSAPGGPPPASAAAAQADTAAAPAPRVVRVLREFTVHGTALRDVLSTESRQSIPPSMIEALPVDRLSSLVALQAGVVVHGEDLHVRGGRSGELETLIDGVPANEPIRGRPLTVPLVALRDAELMSGGLDANYGGALAGVLALRTAEAGDHFTGALQWQTDGRTSTDYDRVSASARGPLAATGLGLVAAAEATLDDTPLPALRSNGRRRILGGSWGWRAANQLFGQAKLSTLEPVPRLSLETVTSRQVIEPYDPMWSLDGWTTPCPDPDCLEGPTFRTTPAPGFERYRAADHAVMTDERRWLTILAWQSIAHRRQLGASLAWARTRSITSRDGRDDESYLAPDHAPLFGYADSPISDPFHVYLGDEPYFRKSQSDELSLSGRWESVTAHGNTYKAGLGLLYDAVELRELDLSMAAVRADSLRAYRAWAPGGYAYGHARWVFEGMAANLGLRLEYFTAGPQAASQSLGQPAHGFWMLSPRMGIAFPLSTRDVFSLSYTRIRQAPERDFLYDNRLNVTNRQPIGNPALQPATVISYQAAVKHLLGRLWSVQAAVFYRDLFDLVGARNTQPELTLPRLVYQNSDNGNVIGWELSALRVEGKHSRIELHYTWMDARGTGSREEGVPFGPLLRARPESIDQHPLDWDRRHSISLAWLWHPNAASIAWTTAVGSPLPWTPSERRALDSNTSQVNSRRLGWDETSALALRWTPPLVARKLTVGLDVLNVFDTRNEVAATVDGYPNPAINTVYDDYGAYRTETGNRGGAYWNDSNGDGIPGWIPVNDPRLFSAPRTVRLSLGGRW